MVGIDWYLALSAVIFTIGMVGVLIRRNAIDIISALQRIANILKTQRTPVVILLSMEMSV